MQLAFNSETYRMNKFRRDRGANLARAREIKARLVAGQAYEWEGQRIDTFAKLARIDNRLFLSARRGRRLKTP